MVRTCAGRPPTPDSPLYAVATTYLLHGLSYAGRREEAIREAVVAEARPGDPVHRWMNAQSARGLMRLVDDDIEGARRDLESSGTAASGLGMLNTAAFSWAYLARAEWMAGLWDDALVHAERAVSINLESDLGFLHTAVTGIAVLVPAARGDWATADPLVRTMTERDARYERAVVAVAMSRARVGEARGDADSVIDALEPVRAIAFRDGADEPGFWPWPDLYADALVGTGRFDDADAFLRPHEELAAERGRRIVMARLARSRGRIEAAAGRPETAEAAFTRALELLDGLHVPFELARVELAAGAVLRRIGRRRRAAELLTSAQDRFIALGATPYARALRPGAGSVRADAHPAHRPGPSRPDVAGAGGRPARRRGSKQPGDRRRTGRQHQDRRVPPAQRVRQARNHLAPAAGGSACRSRRTTESALAAVTRRASPR